MNSTVYIKSDADYGKKPWVAKVLKRDPKKGFVREFLGTNTVAETGLYNASRRKGVQSFTLVVRDDQEGLVAVLGLGNESLALVLDRYGVDRIKDMVPFKDADGYWRIRRVDGTIKLRDSHAALAAERERLLARLAEIEELLRG